jgi:alkylglycerol monooxygenase
MGFLDSFLNTPSNHRVHHGSNEKYIDRNHGGVLIVWDKLFGTFQREEEEPAYGVTRPLANWNPFWANVQYLSELVSVARRARRFRDKILIFLKPPGWRPADVPFDQPPYTPLDGRKYDAQPPAGLQVNAIVQFLLAMGAVIALLFGGTLLGDGVKVALAVFAVWGLVDVGGIFDRRAWLPPSEVVRWTAAVVTTVLLVPPAWRLAAGLAALVVALLVVVPIVRRRAAFEGGERPLPVLRAGEEGVQG